jgi:hypothetical protein
MNVVYAGRLKDTNCSIAPGRIFGMDGDKDHAFV